jgi:hypothetical protein
LLASLTPRTHPLLHHCPRNLPPSNLKLKRGGRNSQPANPPTPLRRRLPAKKEREESAERRKRQRPRHKPAARMEKSSQASAPPPPPALNMEAFQLEGKKPVKNPFVPIGTRRYFLPSGRSRGPFAFAGRSGNGTSHRAPDPGSEGWGVGCSRVGLAEKALTVGMGGR